MHDFSKDKVVFAEIRKTLKISKAPLTHKLRQLAMLPCYPKELLRKTSSVNLKKSLGSVGVAVKVEINKPLAEYPSATFAGVLAMKRINVSKKLF